jgi:hypothetical protein
LSNELRAAVDAWADEQDDKPRRGDLQARAIRPEDEDQGLAMEGGKQAKELKTAAELEAMILEDLSNVDGCPESGIIVTVYGIPWKSMLTFGAAAGPVRNKAELLRFSEIITERLQRLYDVV